MIANLDGDVLRSPRSGYRLLVVLRRAMTREARESQAQAATVRRTGCPVVSKDLRGGAAIGSLVLLHRG